ncbi:MAG: hypothetical protein J6B53_02985 [Clostridia bacterium]|nr:hypothetical protein [Clostridia bacterium]
MRSNRSSYTLTPAGSANAIERKAKQKRPKKEINQIMLIVFFIVLPVLGLLAVFFQPFRFLFILGVVASITAMWLLNCFLPAGRLLLSGVYGFLAVITLVAALSRQDQSAGTLRQNSLLTPIPLAEATTTPAFENMYNTMGTSVPAEYYADLEGSSAGAEGTEGTESGFTDPGYPEGMESGQPSDGAYVPDVKSGAEIALENFMEKWYKQITADMVEYTSPSWRDAQTDQDPEHKLFWKFQSKKLVDWRQMSAPSGTDASDARTIAVQADVEYNGEVRTYEYQAITLQENGQWYVDPESLSSGQLVEKATPTPDPNLTPTPSPEPTPTPTPGPKTKLYYNKDGGKKYHLDPNCPSVASRYLPLKGTFTYKDLSKSPYNKLSPCDKCGAPVRQ